MRFLSVVEISVFLAALKIVLNCYKINPVIAIGFQLLDDGQAAGHGE